MFIVVEGFFFTRRKQMSRIRVVAVLDVDMRDNARIYFLHWQHFPELLPSADLAVVPDGVNADELHTKTWERWGRKPGQETSAASAPGVSKKHSLPASYWRLLG